MDAYEIDTLSETEMITIAMNLSQRYNEIITICSCLAADGKQLIKPISMDAWRINPNAVIQSIRHNLQIIDRTLENLY